MGEIIIYCSEAPVLIWVDLSHQYKARIEQEAHLTERRKKLRTKILGSHFVPAFKYKLMARAIAQW